MPILAPFDLFTATAAGSTLSKLAFPGATFGIASYPAQGTAKSITSTVGGTTVIGGIFAPQTGWGAVNLDFAVAGAADTTLVVEIGGVQVPGAIPEVIASVSLKSITNSGTFTANLNPFTGKAVAATTYRLIDLTTITTRSNVAQLVTLVGGLEDDTPSTLLLDVRQFCYYYVLVTNLGANTSALCDVTPTGAPFPVTTAGEASPVVAHVIVDSGLISTNADSVVAGGTAPAKALLSAVQYNATEPVLTTGQACATQGDSSGNTIVDQMRADPSNDGIGAAKVNSQPVAVTTSGAGYVSGDVVGGIISLTTVNYSTGRRVVLRSFQLNDKGGSAIGYNIYFFKATPAAGTYTDNGAISWGAGDSANKVGQLKVSASDYMTDNSQSSANYSNMNMKMQVSATTLFMLIVAQAGATLTNGNITFDAEFDQE